MNTTTTDESLIAAYCTGTTGTSITTSYGNYAWPSDAVITTFPQDAPFFGHFDFNKHAEKENMQELKKAFMVLLDSLVATGTITHDQHVAILKTLMGEAK